MSVGSDCPTISGLSFVRNGPVHVGAGAGKAQVLEFWATWCPPCRATIPHLTSLAHKYKGRIEFVGISTDDNISRVETFVKQMGDKMDYTVAVDTGGKAQAELYAKSEARGIPHAFIVDASGRIAFSGHPQDPQFEAKLAQVAASACAPAAAPEEALPQITASYEDLMGRSAKELKTILTERGIGTSDCVEKTDLARKIMQTCATTTYYKQAS